MIQVTSLGDVNIDIIVNEIMDFKNFEGEQKFLEKVKIKVGGGAANFAVWLSKFGMKVRLIGCIGNDIFSSFIQKELNKFDIDLRLTQVNSPTGITLALQEKERKLLLTYRGNNKIFSLNHINLKDIEGEVLYISGYNLLDELKKDFSKILSYAKEKSMITCLDPDLKANLNFSKNEFFDVVKDVDVLFLNEEEAKKISNNFNWFKGRTLVIKRGSKGAFAFEKNEKSEVEGLKIKALNTTGAGDVFNAAFLHHYYYGYDLQECLEFANEQAVEYIKEINY